MRWSLKDINFLTEVVLRKKDLLLYAPLPPTVPRLVCSYCDAVQLRIHLVHEYRFYFNRLKISSLKDLTTYSAPFWRRRDGNCHGRIFIRNIAWIKMIDSPPLVILLSLLRWTHDGVVSWGCDANRTFNLLWLKLTSVSVAHCFKLGFIKWSFCDIQPNRFEYKVFLTLSVITVLFYVFIMSYYLKWRVIAHNFLATKGYWILNISWSRF